jgi:hypothetical protein
MTLEAFPVVPPPVYASSAPANPVDGQVWVYRFTPTLNGSQPTPAGVVEWRFAYNATAARWQFAGGPQVVAEESAGVSYTTGSVGTGFATNASGPTFQVPFTGIYRVGLSAYMGLQGTSPTSASQLECALYDQTSSALLARSVVWAFSANAAFQWAAANVAREPLRYALTAGHVIGTQERNTAGALPAVIQQRTLTFLPESLG